MDPSESILQTVKKYLGIEPDYTHFDPTLVNLINSAFFILNQLGVGPESPFTIEDQYNTWDEFTGAGVTASVITYICEQVQLHFDPPTSSYLNESLGKKIDELGFRLLVQADEELTTE